MYTRYYDSYPAMPPFKETAKNENIQMTEAAETTEIAEKAESVDISSQIASRSTLFGSVQADDIILVVLLFLLLSESDDIIMLIIIGFLLIGDKLPF